VVADSGAPADGVRATDAAAADSARAADTVSGAVRGGRAAGAVPDTEQLRLLMRRYRSLLEQICPPQ